MTNNLQRAFLTSNSHALLRLERRNYANCFPVIEGILSSSYVLPTICSSRNDSSFDTTKRLYHATSKRQIFPLVAVSGIFFVGRYSWKALNRMDSEWKDYLWELKQYERARVDSATVNSFTIGVDLGTFYLKLSRINGNKPELIETAQGDRYRFNGVLFKENDDEIVMGKPALDKFYYEPTNNNNNNNKNKSNNNNNNNTSANDKVLLPYTVLREQSQKDATALVQKVFIPAVAEAMERVGMDKQENGANTANTSQPNLRTVLALPPIFYINHGQALFRKNFHDDSHHTITVPEPVAAIWGAQAMDLIPTPKSEEENISSSTLVMDIGGLASTISLVRDDKIVWSVTLDGIGGEILVQKLVDRILVEVDDKTMGSDTMSLKMIQASARSSVLELVKKSQSQIHIPFLFMGRRPDDPHLNTTISRIVLEQAVQDYWIETIFPKLMENNVLSSSLPTPTDVTSLLTSAITKVLEESNEIPNNIGRILLVGGGSKHKVFEDGCKSSISALMGSSNYESKLVLPDVSLRAELTCLGASSLLPNFDYDYDKGLEMVQA